MGCNNSKSGVAYSKGKNSEYAFVIRALGIKYYSNVTAINCKFIYNIQ